MRSWSSMVAVVSAILLGLAWLVSRFPALVESVYSERIFPLAIRILTAVSGLFPFSLAEMLIVSAVIWLALMVTKGIRRLLAGRQTLGGWARAGTGPVAAVILAFLASGYLFWGLNYAREEASTRLGWENTPPREDRAAELAELAKEAVDLVNASYSEAYGGEDRGQGPRLPANPARWDRSLDQGYAAAATEFGLGPPFGLALGRAKPFLGSSLLSRFGISGFYFPWTGEANYNQLTPVPERIHAIAHEKAHQRGIASEDEASFFGFLACALSTTAETRYAGWLFAQRQLLNQLALTDLEQARVIANGRSPGVRRDEDEIHRFWRGYQGAATQVGATVNNSYLRLHGVAGGIDSYNRTARLLVLLARTGRGLNPNSRFPTPR